MQSRFNSYSVLLVAIAWLATSTTSGQTPGEPPAPALSAAAPTDVKLTPEEIENLVAPIALYPDVLLAQVLAAATYPMDVVMAARWLQSNPDMAKLTEQPWDPSVLSLCHYPDIIQKMNHELDWTNALGAAFLDQQEDVMAMIQELRARANASGALTTTPEQTIVIEQETIQIVPTQPEVVYVPQYNPQVVYVEHHDDDDELAAAAIGFGAGLAMGAWLDMDCDWHGWGVAYCRPGYWGGYGHRGVVAWGDDWAAAMGPRRAAVRGEHGGAYVGPRGAAVWGDNGHGAAWRRGPTPYGRPTYGGRYASYDRRSNISGNQRFSNNNINVNRNNINVDRGDRTNIAGGNRGTVSGNRRNYVDGRGGTNARTDGRRSAFNDSSGRAQASQYSNRGARSRESYTGQSPSQRSGSASRQSGSRSSSYRSPSSSSGRSAFSGSGGSSRQSVRQSSSRGHSSRSSGSRGGGRRGGGGRGRR